MAASSRRCSWCGKPQQGTVAADRPLSVDAGPGGIAMATDETHGSAERRFGALAGRMPRSSRACEQQAFNGWGQEPSGPSWNSGEMRVVSWCD